MAAKTQDYSKALKDFMGAFPVDLGAYQDAFKSSAEFNEKLSVIAFDAVSRTTDIATALTKDTLAGLGQLTKAKADVTEYAKAASDFFTAQSEVLSGHMTAFGEIVKRANMDAADVVMAAGKTFSEDASAAVKKATDEVAKIAKAA